MGWVLFGWKSGKSSKFCPILDIQEPLTDFHRNEAKKIKIKNGPKWPTQKKLSFSKSPILKFFFPKISEIGPWISRIN